MSEPKLTAGPWRYGVRPDGSMWLSLGNPSKGPHYQGDLVASVADANAIIATRELYVALEDLIDLAAAAIRTGAYEGEVEIRNAYAALAKARGQV